MKEKIEQMGLKELNQFLTKVDELRIIASNRYTKLRIQKDEDDIWTWIRNNLGEEVIIKYGSWANMKGTICIEHNQRKGKYVKIKPYQEEYSDWKRIGGWKRDDYCCVKFPTDYIGIPTNELDIMTAQMNKEIMPVVNQALSKILGGN